MRESIDQILRKFEFIYNLNEKYLYGFVYCFFSWMTSIGKAKYVSFLLSSKLFLLFFVVAI